jgi:hypothetical protein
VYGLREKIQLQISSSANNGSAMPANLSVAVHKVDDLQGNSAVDINSYLWLTADLGEQIESPGYYFLDDGVGKAAAVDNLMLTHGWRRFSWTSILGNTQKQPQFIPEYAGHVITGRVTQTKSGLPAKDITCYLTVTGTQKQFRVAVSDSSGAVKFDLGDFYNDGELFVQTNPRTDSGYTIELIKPFSNSYSSTGLPAFSWKADNRQLLQQHNAQVQVQSAFVGNKQAQYFSADADTSSFYLIPDASYQLDNFVRFTTMEEVLREYVYEVNVRKRGGVFFLYVYDKKRNYTYETEPLVLVDGLPVFDMNKLLAYDPLKVKRLEVVTRGYYLGNMSFTGIVNFITYQGNLDGFELDPHTLVLDYEGLQLQREFYSPVYSNQQQVASRLPDYRNLLFWNPSVTTNEKGRQSVSFYSSDIPGKYAVELQGISADGKTGSKLVYFEVKK